MDSSEHLISEYEHKIVNDVSQLINFCYEVIQSFVIWLFSPPHEGKAAERDNGIRIAVIGAGITGLSAAAHCRGHGAEVTLFEARGRENLGGIWSRVNSTSSLQVYSLMYRFHPTVRWHRRYPHKDRILEEVNKLWRRYGLEKCTHFDTPVTSVTLQKRKWIINNDAGRYGYFDGVIPAIGTCGEPKMPKLPGEESFTGTICHSSQMDDVDVTDKVVMVVGGGASAIEVVEHAVAKNAKEIVIVSRSQKWIIPRNVVVDILLSLNVFGEETSFSFIPEYALRWFFYRDLKDLAPQRKGFYTGTAMCNDQILEQIRTGRCRWLASDIIHVTQKGLLINHRSPKVPQHGPGTQTEVSADIMVMATGFQRPNPHFLPHEVFDEPFRPPAWYLQTFPTEHAEICAINSMYINALGTVANVHIGMYARLLMAFLLAPETKPTTAQMRRWVSMVGKLKHQAPQKAFDYFTYSELMLWFVSVVVLKPSLWPWAWFVFTGLSSVPNASPSQSKASG
ncbi:hypothetical protein LTR06_006988 [Exophiala xenobiotica]|nr:hypothetical protein LTR06_006988 [Exophiala xenobiotica]